MNRKTTTNRLHLSHHGLFVIAAIAWLIAGTMLIIKGFQFIPATTSLLYIKILLAFIAGLLFYRFVFTKVILKYTDHILSLAPQQKHPPYKVFRLRFYLLIAVMISAGVILRTTGIVPIEYLALFYFTMGTPLLISSFKFLQRAKKAEAR